MTASRLLRLDDAPALAELLVANREFLAPTAPFRPEEFFTSDGQRARAVEMLNQYEAGALLPHVILDGTGQVAGQITLNEIVRGPFQSCRVGYWLAQGSNGRGLATAALGNVKGIAFEELGLHRIEAGTLLDNERSQRVLLRNGFEQFGLAPRYLKIAGDWRDHVLFQTIND